MPRVVWQILVLAAALGVVFAVGKGLMPMFPALAGVLKALFNPWVRLGVLALAVLVRLRPSRPGNGPRWE